MNAFRGIFTSLVALLCLAASGLGGTIAIYAGSSSFVSASGGAYAAATEKQIVVLDRLSGRFQRIRLYRVGTAKNFTLTTSGVFDGHVTPADKKLVNQAYTYVYRVSVNGMPGLTSDEHRWLQFKGLATAAAGTSTGLDGPIPPTLTLVEHFSQTQVGLPPVIPRSDSTREEKGSVKLDRVASLASNEGGDDFAAALLRTKTRLISLGYVEVF
ncbi:MAG: hypothetical protein WCF18_22825 [Chthoniobacteraceae bacterium]